MGKPSREIIVRGDFAESVLNNQQKRTGKPYITCSTLRISGISFNNFRSTPARSVILDIGHERHDPTRRTSTKPSSVMRTNSTSPPSACRNGRTESSDFRTLSFRVINNIGTTARMPSYQLNYYWLLLPSDISIGAACFE